MSPALLRVVVVLALAGGPAPAVAAASNSADADWKAFDRESHEALAALGERIFRSARVDDPAMPPPQVGDAMPNPRMIIVGFTGGLEGRDSSASGVVRIRRNVGAHLGQTAEVTALTYNNFTWRQAGRDVLALVRDAGDELEARRRPGAPESETGTPPPVPQPLIVVYGHSWGAGSIAKLARVLRDENLDISLAVYMDAFTLRNPRLPANIRYAVNVYQRSGILRGLPLRGKRHLLPESPESTVVLGSYRIRPQTGHFGWSWNIVQPLLYRHHHRIGHDVRLRQYLLEIIALKLELLALAGGQDPVVAASGDSGD